MGSSKTVLGPKYTAWGQKSAALALAWKRPGLGLGLKHPFNYLLTTGKGRTVDFKVACKTESYRHVRRLWLVSWADAGGRRWRTCSTLGWTWSWRSPNEASHPHSWSCSTPQCLYNQPTSAVPFAFAAGVGRTSSHVSCLRACQWLGVFDCQCSKSTTAWAINTKGGKDINYWRPSWWCNLMSKRSKVKVTESSIIQCTLCVKCMARLAWVCMSIRLHILLVTDRRWTFSWMGNRHHQQPNIFHIYHFSVNQGSANRFHLGFLPSHLLGDNLGDQKMAQDNSRMEE